LPDLVPVYALQSGKNPSAPNGARTEPRKR
jgi:hypothetical protein